jgi:DNA (cytosine-5)-methyltransferase 1
VISTLDLFVGAGGFSLGLQMADLGFESVLAVEIDQAAARTFKANFGCEAVNAPIETIERFPDAEVIVGGPPCQGFSPLGRDRDDRSRSMLNSLWREYIRAVRQVMPTVFMIENVPEFQKFE